MEEGKIHERMCGTQVWISGLLANEGDMLLTQLQCPMGCCGYHAVVCNQNNIVLHPLVKLTLDAR